MSRNQEFQNLKELLDRIETLARRQSRISLGDVLEEVGHRSFGPLLLLAGVIMAAPVVGDIPGIPSLVAIIVLLAAGQLLLGRRHFWLPQVLMKRSLSREKVCKAVSWLYKPARLIDRLIGRRLTSLIRKVGRYLIAVTSVVIAVATPAMELVPFSANIAGLALAAFGLAIIAQDGLVALIAFLMTVGTMVVIFYNWL